DITDPPAAHITHQVNVGASALSVATAANVAFVGTADGRVVAVDMSRGVTLTEVEVGGGVVDVRVDGNDLYALTNSDVSAYRLFPGFMNFLSRAPLSGYFPEGITGTRRLFVGGGVAYVTAYPGYDTFDTSDPSALKLLGQARDGGPNSFKQIVTNGSG